MLFIFFFINYFTQKRFQVELGKPVRLIAIITITVVRFFFFFLEIQNKGGYRQNSAFFLNIRYEQFGAFFTNRKSVYLDKM